MSSLLRLFRSDSCGFLRKMTSAAWASLDHRPLSYGPCCVDGPGNMRGTGGKRSLPQSGWVSGALVRPSNFIHGDVRWAFICSGRRGFKLGKPSSSGVSIGTVTTCQARPGGFLPLFTKQLSSMFEESANPLVRYSGRLAFGAGVDLLSCSRLQQRSKFTLVRRAVGKKERVMHYCENCNAKHAQHMGKCTKCNEYNTIKTIIEARPTTPGRGGGPGARAVQQLAAEGAGWAEPKGKGSGPARGSWVRDDLHGSPQRIGEIRKSAREAGRKSSWRIQLEGVGGSEVMRVLGGGVVPGALILLGGDPGVGKSTLLLQIAAMMSRGSMARVQGGTVVTANGDAHREAIGRIGEELEDDEGEEEEEGEDEDDDGAATVPEGGAVLYVSAEENQEQICSRADRMNLNCESLYLYSATNLQAILEHIARLRPRAVIVDSIQTVYLDEANGSAGSVPQVRECTTALLHHAKEMRIPIFLVGHVTKSGDIAGPRVLEHIVDVVLYLEVIRNSLMSHRLLRAVKNRYGGTEEVGVFRMNENGMEDVDNPNEMLLGERMSMQAGGLRASSAVAVTMEGSRALLLEVQALCSHSYGQGNPQRNCTGVDLNRLFMLLAVLTKVAGLKLGSQDIFLNVVGGFRLTEPASDLAIAIAIASSFKECPIPTDMAFVGEIGLGGELRAVSRLERRLTEAAKLGFKSCIVPRSYDKDKGLRVPKGFRLIECYTLKEAIAEAFRD